MCHFPPKLQQKFAAYRTLRLERMNLRQVGPRKKKAEEAAKEEAVRIPRTPRPRLNCPLQMLRFDISGRTTDRPNAPLACLRSCRRRPSKRIDTRCWSSVGRGLGLAGSPGDSRVLYSIFCARLSPPALGLARAVLSAQLLAQLLASLRLFCVQLRPSSCAESLRGIRPPSARSRVDRVPSACWGPSDRESASLNICVLFGHVQSSTLSHPLQPPCAVRTSEDTGTGAAATQQQNQARQTNRDAMTPQHLLRRRLSVNCDR